MNYADRKNDIKYFSFILWKDYFSCIWDGVFNTVLFKKLCQLVNSTLYALIEKKWDLSGDDFNEK